MGSSSNGNNEVGIMDKDKEIIKWIEDWWFENDKEEEETKDAED